LKPGWLLVSLSYWASRLAYLSWVIYTEGGGMNNKLGDVIKERRKSRGLTLKQVSSLSGVSMSHLGRSERGDRFPSGSILRKLAEPLDFTEVELFKLAGYLSRDDSDRQIERLKKEIKSEISEALTKICERIDNF